MCADFFLANLEVAFFTKVKCAPIIRINLRRQSFLELYFTQFFKYLTQFSRLGHWIILGPSLHHVYKYPVRNSFNKI